MASKKNDKVIVKEFTRLDQLIEFFPARDLRADYITVKPGKNIGAHRALNRKEVVGVLQGIAQIVVDNEVYKLRKDEMIYIPKGKLRNVYNRNKINLKIVFVVSKIDADKG